MRMEYLFDTGTSTSCIQMLYQFSTKRQFTVYKSTLLKLLYITTIAFQVTSRCEGFGSTVTWTDSPLYSRSTDEAEKAKMTIH